MSQHHNHEAYCSWIDPHKWDPSNNCKFRFHPSHCLRIHLNSNRHSPTKAFHTHLLCCSSLHLYIVISPQRSAPPLWVSRRLRVPSP
jgi:hypothetical protein